MNALSKMPASGIILLLILVSCRKEKIVEVPVPTEKKFAWEEIKSLQFSDRAQLNAAPVNDSQILFRNKTNVLIYNTNTLKQTGGYFWGFHEMEIAAKPDLHSEILMRATQDIVHFAPLKALVTSDAGAALNPKFEGDTNFVRFSTQFIHFNPQFHLVNNRYVLIPFVSKKENNTRSYAYLVRLLRTPWAGMEAVRVDKVITVELNTSVVSLPNYLYSSAAHFHKFFVSNGSTTFRVDSTGNVKDFGAPMYSVTDIFRLEQTLFAVNPNGRFYISTDLGESWTLFNQTGNTIFGFIGFEQVGDEVFAYYRDQIWQVTKNATALEFTELNNEGLERTLITSITKAGDKAFVTTKYGVFFRKWADFKQKKPA